MARRAGGMARRAGGMALRVCDRGPWAVGCGPRGVEARVVGRGPWGVSRTEVRDPTSENVPALL